MPILNALTGFREDQLDMGFEKAWRLSFTLVGVRADDPVLDMALVWEYQINGTTRLKGNLRTLEERLSPDEDYQRYEITDRFDDVVKEPLLRINDAGCMTSRFLFNDEKKPAIVESALNTALISLVGSSAIFTGIVFDPPGGPTEIIEKNIGVESRNIGEMITELLKFNPWWRWYYRSSDGKAVFKNLEVVTPKSVYLSKMYGKWHLRTPKFNNVVSVNFNIDATECYEKVRLEGLGEYTYDKNTRLEPAWYECIEPPEYTPFCQNLRNLDPILDVEELFRNIAYCPVFACRYKFPAGFTPSPVSFSAVDGKWVASSQNEIVIDAEVPSRNNGPAGANPKDFLLGKGTLITKFKTYSSSLASQGGNYNPGFLGGSGLNNQGMSALDPGDTPASEAAWEWTDFVWIEMSRVPPNVEPDACGQIIVNLCPHKMMTMLGVYSPPQQGHQYDSYATHPHLIVFNMRAKYWKLTDCLIAEITGGCPNGRVYHRYNADWARVIDGNGTVVRNDKPAMIAFATRLLQQIGKPKVSATIDIHLHPRDVSTGDESYIEPEVIPMIDYLGIEIGDSINIDYETPGAGELVTGPGVLPDAAGGGGDLFWNTMELRVMGMRFDRRAQRLTLELANSSIIIGDRGLDNLQR